MATVALRTLPAARRASALYCGVHGRGTPLLLLHGLGACGAVFQPLLPTLSARFQTIVPDLRGHGQSSRLPGPDTIERMTDDVVNLLDLLGVDACFVLGHGTGGAVAQQLARAHPLRVRGLALVGSFARSATTLREHIEARLQPGLYRMLGARRMSELAVRNAPHADAGFVRDVLGNNCGGRVAPVARALLTFDSRSWLAGVACPVLVVAGERDTTAPVRHSRELAYLLPNARLAILPHAGHWMLQTHADALLDVVLAWMDAVEAA